MNTEKLLLAICCCFLSISVFNTSNCSANHCSPSSCGDFHNISYPFRLKSDPPGCGYKTYELSCEGNSTVLHLSGGRYIVKAINYSNYTIRVVDEGVDKDDCSSLPLFPLSFPDFSDAYLGRAFSPRRQLVDTVKVIKCVKAVQSDMYFDANTCFHQQLNTSSREFYRYSYVGTMNGYDLKEGCTIEAVTLMQPDHSMSSFTELHKQMASGFELWCDSFYCSDHCGYNTCKFDQLDDKVYCYSDKVPLKSMIRGYAIYIGQSVLDSCQYVSIFFGTHFNKTKVLDQIREDISLVDPPIGVYWIFHAPVFLVILYVAGRNLCGSPFVIAFLIYKWRRRHLSNYHTIEEFLQGQNNLMPIRYAYSDIKKMTGGFSEMLGKGGFGSVYKGKLRSGLYAAVKMLETSKAKGQDFINEVATIGRIHHANIVRLIGFCSHGSKHALVYEFMSNGSLDTHIFSHEKSVALSWEKLYEISLGVARGIEYLHRGCDIQILHFDIKPHNILLDENFAPKLSDFGLAKSYKKMDSIASLTAARGTIGYMAPELFYKNIGRVSYKADVYSFGMLLLEMAGKRKNLKVPTENAQGENLSQIYYPFWVYDKLVDGNLEIEDATDEEKKIVRKMIITGLWCIQMQPSTRPSMNAVVEMLEGNLDNLQLPPRPLLFPIQSMKKDVEEPTSSVTVSSSTTFIEDEEESSIV